MKHIDEVYQPNFSKINRDVLDEASRLKKARMICLVLKQELGNLSDKDVLDIGCSSGIITEHLANYCKSAIGIDIDEDAIAFANASREAVSNVQFRTGDAMNIPVESGSVDIVICNHVLEHVPNQQRLFKEIGRVLKINGICYLSVGNKYTIMEPHYHIPFLSWSPRRVADFLVRALGKGECYYERLPSYRALQKLVKDRFHIENYTPKTIKHPTNYGAEDVIRPNSIITKLPTSFLERIMFIASGWIIILRKK